MTAVGDVLTSTNDEFPPLKVVGGIPGEAWIVNETDEHAAGPRRLTDDEAVAYSVGDAPQKGDEQAGWDEMGEATHRRSVLPPRPLSPEDRFAAGTADPVRIDPGYSEGESRQWPTIKFTES